MFLFSSVEESIKEKVSGMGYAEKRCAVCGKRYAEKRRAIKGERYEVCGNGTPRIRRPES
jgi:hypothetical protein